MSDRPTREGGEPVEPNEYYPTPSLTTVLKWIVGLGAVWMMLYGLMLQADSKLASDWVLGAIYTVGSVLAFTGLLICRVIRQAAESEEHR